MTTTSVEKVKEKVINRPPILSIEGLIRKSADQLKMALPAHMRPERIVRIALTTLKTNPTLYKCDPYSLLAALFQSAQLGLEPNLNGEAWIIPYNLKGRLTAQFQIGVYGLVKLFWNHQNSISLQVECVRKNDVFEYDLGENKIHHVPLPFDQNRGEVIGYYATAHLTGGGRALKVMSKDEVFQHAKRFSKCYSIQDGKFMTGTPWNSHFDAMAMKTVLKQLMKLLPKSVEIQKALAMDETVKTKIATDMVEIPNEDDFSSESEERKEIENQNDQNGDTWEPSPEEKNEIKQQEIRFA